MLPPVAKTKTPRYELSILVTCNTQRNVYMHTKSVGRASLKCTITTSVALVVPFTISYVPQTHFYERVSYCKG